MQSTCMIRAQTDRKRIKNQNTLHKYQCNLFILTQRVWFGSFQNLKTILGNYSLLPTTLVTLLFSVSFNPCNCYIKRRENCVSMGSETETQIHHIVNIPEMIEPMLHEQCCIYKVPNHLLKLNEEAFTPKFISIGPFHSHNPELNQEKQKQRYFHAFWKRLSNKQGLALVQYKGFLEENKENIAKCYSKHDVCVLEKFVEMILLDSVFIMELFLRKSNESEQKNDFMFMISWIYRITQRDLLLLENQIPMFVLEELHKRVLGGNCVSFIELAFNYFEDYYPQKKSLKDEMIRKCESCKHFTDLIRYSYLPRKIQEKGVNQSENFTKFSSEYVLRTATKLNEAGISFEKVQGRSYCDIKFKKTPILNWFLCLGCLPCFRFVESKLRIPHLKVDQSTECVLRNLIALEQCHYSNQPFVCNYVSLIDSLIHTHEDVELLVDTEIVSHELGSHAELATLVNCLCRHVVVTSNCYGEMVKELNEHYNNVWKHYMGMLRSVYFRDPWRLSSTVVGVSIFLFAFVNFLKVIGVFSPKY